MMNAYEEVLSILGDGESVEAIVFGPWGWSSPDDIEDLNLGFHEPEDPPVPFEMRGTTMSLEEARPYMQSWSFLGGFGAPECYATYIWTNHRILWVTQYDGATGIDSAPRNPCDCIPEMPGG